MTESLIPEALQEPVSVDDNAASLTIDNAALSVTGGGVEAGALRVTLANDSTGLVSVDDNAGSLTVDNSTLAVVGGGTEATALRVTLANDSTGVVSVDDNGSSLTIDGTVTIGDGTDNVDVLADGADNVANTVNQLVTAAVLYAFDGTTYDRVTIGGGVEATALRVTLANDSTGLVSVDDNGGSLTVDNSTLAVVGGGTEAAAMRVTIANDSTGLVSVDDNGGSLTVDQGAAGTAWEVIGDVAHDAVAPGNPVVTGGQMETMADSAPGTRAGTDGDAVKFATTDGALFVVTSGPQQWKARIVNTTTADTTVKAAPGAGLSLYITDVVFSIGAATASSILLEESTTTAVFGPHYLEAINGRGLSVHFTTPIKIAANTLLSCSPTGAATNTLDVYGFTAPG